MVKMLERRAKGDTLHATWWHRVIYELTRLVSVVVTVLWLAACGEPPSADLVRLLLDDRVRHSSPGRIEMVNETRFAWTTLYLFAPYTPAERIATSLAIDGKTAARLARDIGTRDDVNLLVFQLTDGTWKSFTHSRKITDFGPELIGRPYSPSSAVFRVRRPPPGSWGTIGPDVAPGI